MYAATDCGPTNGLAVGERMLEGLTMRFAYCMSGRSSAYDDSDGCRHIPLGAANMDGFGVGSGIDVHGFFAFTRPGRLAKLSLCTVLRQLEDAMLLSMEPKVAGGGELELGLSKSIRSVTSEE